MTSTVRVEYQGGIHQLQATNNNGNHASPVGAFSKIFGELQAPVRATAESAGNSVFFDNVTQTIIITDALPGGITKAELDILHRITQAEAGGEDIHGRILVVNVIMNRVHSDLFPQTNSIKEVVFAPNQFEPTRNGAFARAVVSQSTKEAVQRALHGEDHSHGALFFRSTRGLRGSWHETSLNHIFTHGGHAFFKPN
ncbi:MAG: cell wall hydrolase [Defluviitaleaceae bacterium]|nr:cell wall hydrolase [Defluviitaleaceae bacterium]